VSEKASREYSPVQVSAGKLKRNERMALTM
jgi:hypothetical protein